MDHGAQKAFYTLDVTLNPVPVAELVLKRTILIGTKLRMRVDGHGDSCTSF